MEIDPRLASLLNRRSVSPKRLGMPGPTPEELNVMVDAALSAPDHGALQPWRLIAFPAVLRGRLADVFEAEKRRRDPLASPSDLERARQHATSAPVVLAFVIRPCRNVAVPVHEQWLCAGAALGQLLLCAHYMHYGAIVLSGERCADEPLRTALGVEEHETLAGFVSMGSIVKASPAPCRPSRERVLSTWTPQGSAVTTGKHGRSGPVEGAEAARGFSGRSTSSRRFGHNALPDEVGLWKRHERPESE